jgi:hypothetical protein
MLHLPHYGIPDNYPKTFEDFISAKEIADLYDELCMAQKNTSIKDIVEKYAEHPYFNYALGYCAVKENLALLVPIVYAIPFNKRSRVHFEWKIPHDEFELTFSNAYFIVYFNELYRKTPDLVGRNLAAKGVALRALAHLSYTSWTNFMLPISEESIEFFLKMPLCDRDSQFLGIRGEVL